MERIRHNLTGDFSITFTSDWQVGASGSSTHIIDQILEPVKARKNHYLILAGDLIDAITTKDRRFSWEDLAPTAETPLDQAIFVVGKLRSLRRKILSFGSGNHELAVRDFGDPTRMMAMMIAGDCQEDKCDLGMLCKNEAHREYTVPYGGYSALIELGKSKIFAWHGRPSVRSNLLDPLQRQLALKRRLVSINKGRWDDCDINVSGHTNQLLVVRPDETKELRLNFDESGHIGSSYENTDHRYYVSAGSAQKLFVEGRTTYAEAAGYKPLPLGCVDAKFEDGRPVEVKERVLG